MDYLLRWLKLKRDSPKTVILQKLYSPSNNGESPSNNGESNKTVSVDKVIDTTIAEINSAEGFSLKEEIKKLENNPRRDLNIIALYLEYRMPDIRNKGQFQKVLKRHMRPAKELTPFEDDQIIRAFEKSKEQTKDWTIETAIKNATK